MHFLSTNITTVLSLIFLLVSPLPSIGTAASDTNKENVSFLHQVCAKLDLNEDQCCTLGKTSSFLTYSSMTVVAGTIGIPGVLAFMGFTKTGIVAGSLAAWYQAKFGIGPVFSFLQSAGMTNTIGTLVNKAGVGIAATRSYYSNCGHKEQRNKGKQREP